MNIAYVCSDSVVAHLHMPFLRAGEHFLEPSSILSYGHWRWPHVWPELLADFQDIGARSEPRPAQIWAPE